MTMVEQPPLTAPAPAAPPKQELKDQLVQWGVRAEELLDRLGDHVNPILVKEARQAMKSKQFSITFSLLLLIGWLWTAIYIALTVPGLYYAPWGMSLLGGYLLILTIPLLIVVPYAAFRSLAAETEDGTFELLSITSLSARQIVAGKLGSAILQMMVYYSALAPCIAFTYLLKGVDIISIALLLTYTFVASLMLSIVGLTAATVTRSRHWQILVSVVLVMGLLFSTFFFDYLFAAFVFGFNGNMPYDRWEFWAFNLGAFSFCGAFGTLFLFIAAGQITFASENRSTPVRYVLQCTQALWIGWMMFLWRGFEETWPHIWLWIMVYFAAGFWMLVGSLLSGETGQLSPRAKRNLPQSLLGRVLLTWFNPGSGSGYTFALVNLAVVILTQFLSFAVSMAIGDERAPDDFTWIPASLAVWGYVAGYMGVIRLIVSVARRYTPVNMFMAFLLQIVVAIMGIVIPLIFLSIQSAGDYSLFTYSELQIPNWAWTLYELTEPTKRVMISPFIPASIFALGLVIFLVNLFDTAGEVEQIRTVAPQRVLEDDLSLRPVVKRKKNPWDEDVE